MIFSKSIKIIYFLLQCLFFTVSSTGRCNAILNPGGRCHETKNAHLLHARTESDYLGQISFFYHAHYPPVPLSESGIHNHSHSASIENKKSVILKRLRIFSDSPNWSAAHFCLNRSALCRMTKLYLNDYAANSSSWRRSA